MTPLIQSVAHLPGQPLVHALGWTLLHFLWQGTAVAAMLWCVLGLLGGRSSQVRYGTACLALALMVALPVATFAHIASVEYRMRATTLGSGVVMDAGMVLLVGAEEPVPPWPARIVAALDHSLPWLLLAWFAGVMVFVGRLNFGLMIARRLKTADTEAPPLALQQLFNELRLRLGVRRAVELVHSARVQVPTVIGWLRPVVLLPASCLTGLSPEQIEAVFCHELAHVHRHDYLVSVIQSVIETLLFYHPAVWWVSKEIRRERECCCDELAVGAGGNVLAYARALSYLEERRAAFPEFVLGANGGVLKMRIKRLLGSKDDMAGSPYAAFVVLGVAAALAGSYFVAVSRAQSQTAHAEIASVAEPVGVVSVSQEGATAAANPATEPRGVYKSWLEQDVRWIITDSEAQQFKQLTNDEERDQFIEQFWARRDPPGAAAGTYREEHYARIAYSNEHFASNDHVGWRTDRGHIYIVYGKPESIDPHPAGGASTFPYEVWHYKYIAGIGDKVDLAFVDTCQCGDYHYTIDPTEKEARSFTGPGLVKQESAQLDANDAQISLAKRLLAPGGAGAPQNAAPPTASGAAEQAGSIEGTVIDPTGAVVAGAKMTTVNTDTGVKQTGETNSSGHYSFSPLPPGPYNLEVEAKGFQRLLQENIRVGAGQTVGLNLKLTVGAATENLTVTGKPQATAPPPQWAPPWKPDPPKPTGPQRVSAGVIQGLAILQPPPVYPDEAKANHVQGVVVLHARISREGTVKDVQVVSGPPPLLVSAIDAVRQWKYKPYMLSGEPTEVDTTININFTFEAPAATPSPGQSGEPQSAAAPATHLKAPGGEDLVVLHANVSDAGTPNIRSIEYKGLNAVTIHDVAERFQRDGIGLSLETPHDVARTTRAAASLKQLLAEHGHPNAIVTVATQSIPTGAIGILFTVKEGPKASAATTLNVAPASVVASPTPDALTEYDGVPVRKVGGSVTAPVPIQVSYPEYSREAKKAKFKGIVLVSLIVDANGLPQNVHVLRGVGMGLDEKAVEAVKDYKFKPATEDGKPVPVEVNLEIKFQLDDSAELQTPVLNPEMANATAAPRLKEGDAPPLLIYKVDPEFTEKARKAKASGIVLVNFVVDKQGLPENVHVVHGVGNGLDAKAVEAVKQYKFKPAMRNDQPVEVALNVEVNFQIF
jgi:TonB family protein